MRIFSFLLPVCFISITAFSQISLNDSTANKFRLHIIKWSPLHLSNFYPTLQFAYEYKWSPEFSIQLDAGLVVNSATWRDTERFSDKRGIKLKSEFRYYFYVSESIFRYLSAEAYTNIINFDRNTTQIECFDLDCTIQFSRRYLYKVKYREQGLSFKYGYVRKFDRVILDFNFGLTLRNVEYKKPNLPDALNDFQRDFAFSIPNEEKRLAFSPALGLRIGYIIAQN